ncbi:hypothetical protein KCU94_g223, partial [Aureobasidium melanogenum]
MHITAVNDASAIEYFEPFLDSSKLKASTGATSSIVARFRFLSTVVFCVCGSLMVRVASPPSACRARKAMSSIVCASLPFCAAGSEQECPESLGYGLTTLLNVGVRSALVQVRFPENTDLGLSALPHDGREWLTGSPLQKQRVLVGLRGVVDESVRGSLHSGSSQNHFWRPLKVAVDVRLKESICAGQLTQELSNVKKETKVYKEGRSRRQKHKELWIVSNAPILPTYYGVSNELVLLIRLSDSQQAARLCIGQIFCNPVLLVSQLGQLRRLWLAVLLAAPVAVADLTELRLNDQHGARFCQTTVESRGDADVDRPLDSWHLEDDEALATPSLPTTVTLN